MTEYPDYAILNGRVDFGTHWVKNPSLFRAKKGEQMPLHVYLKDQVRKNPEFSEEMINVVNKVIRFRKVCLFEDAGRKLFCQLLDDTIEIPPELKGFVSVISYRPLVQCVAHREAGIYRHKTAVCEVTTEANGVIRLLATSKSMRSLREILHLIKVGAIRPDESYEAPQAGKSRQQLEGELAQTQQQLGEAWTTIEELKKKIIELGGSAGAWDSLATMIQGFSPILNANKETSSNS